MKKLPFVFIVLFFYNAGAQYYYKDIVGAKDLSNQMKVYLINNVTKVTATGLTPEGVPAKDFTEIHDVNKTANTLKITTRINQTFSSLLHSFNTNGQLIRTVDSAAGVRSVSNYTYDANGNILSITNSADDGDSTKDFSQTETHMFLYNNGKLEKMWRIINIKDSLEVRFAVDENNNVIEEKNFKKGVFTDPIYYYYDNKNRLTDIVRFNYKANRLLPDFLFEYDDNDRVIQKITLTTNRGAGTLTWRYVFNEQGLKTKEALFTREKQQYQLKGRIDYSYN